MPLLASEAGPCPKRPKVWPAQVGKGVVILESGVAARKPDFRDGLSI